MLVKSVELGSSRCAHRATMAESNHGRGRAPSTEAHWGPLRADPQNRRAALWARALRQSGLGRHAKHRRP
eukprot:12346338-Alexandrium_andersonii.AAC.1